MVTFCLEICFLSVTVETGYEPNTLTRDLVFLGTSKVSSATVYSFAYYDLALVPTVIRNYFPFGNVPVSRKTIHCRQ